MTAYWNPWREAYLTFVFVCTAFFSHDPLLALTADGVTMTNTIGHYAGWLMGWAVGAIEKKTAN